MGSYSIRFKPSVEKDLQTLPPEIVRRITERIDRLASEPFPAGSRKLAATGRLYRLRVRDYRIIYEPDSKARTITIHYVRHRREAYRGI
jgi:mRNA interferase RelE/StbE